MKKINIVASLAVAFFCSSAVWATTLSGIKYHSSEITLPEDTATVGISITTEVVTEGVKAVSDSLNAAMQPEKRLFTEGNDTVSTTAKKNGTVTGFVGDSKEGVAVNASVQLYSLPDSLLKGGKSVDENGKYTFNVPAGEYYLLVSFQGEKKTTKKFTVKEGKTEKIKDIEFASKELQETLILSSRTYPVNLSLTVCDLAKLPLTNAMLKIYMLPEGFNSTAEFNTDALTLDTVLYSNLDGKFIVNGLPGENYLLRPYYLDEQLDDIIIRPIKEEAHEDTIIFNTVKHLKQTENLSVKTRDAFISLYKKHVGHSRNAKVYSEVYDYWKRAFCGNSDRYLMLYLDGISIINATISYDMEQKCYDRIEQLGEELMEVFELAIVNMDSLNKQLKEGSDTLTVARLRAQQLEYYYENWKRKKLIDSPNSNLGLNAFFSDSLLNIMSYNMLRPILKSNELDAELRDYHYIAYVLNYKRADEINRYNGNKKLAREFFTDDFNVLEAKTQAKFESLDSIEKNDEEYKEFVISRIRESRFQFTDDIGELVALYKQALDENKPELVNCKNKTDVVNKILDDDKIIKDQAPKSAKELHLKAIQFAIDSIYKEKSPRELYYGRLNLCIQFAQDANTDITKKKEYLSSVEGDILLLLRRAKAYELSAVEKALLYLQYSEYESEMAVIEPDKDHIAKSEAYMGYAEKYGYPVNSIENAINRYNSYKHRLTGNKDKEQVQIASYLCISLSDAIDKLIEWNGNVERQYQYRNKDKIDELQGAIFEVMQTGTDGGYKYIPDKEHCFMLGLNANFKDKRKVYVKGSNNQLSHIYLPVSSDEYGDFKTRLIAY